MKFKKILISAFVCFTTSTVVHSASLNEVVDIAIKTNPDVLAASNERNAVSKEIDQARAGYLPSVDLALGTGYERTDSPSTRSGSNHNKESLNRNEASLNLRQMLFDGMQTKNEVIRHTARTNSRAYSVFGTAENTGLEAVDAYLNVLRRQTLVELTNTNLEAHERTHDQIKLRSDRGVGRKADMEQSQGRVALAKANQIAEQSNLRDAETNFLRVVGVQAEDLSYPDSPDSLIPETLDEAISLAIENHPTLKSANSDIDSANAQHDTALAVFFPRVDIELGTSANNDIDGIEGHQNDVTAMLRLRYNLLDGGKDKARREETAYLIDQASEIRNNTYRQVEQSVRLSWSALETVKNQTSYFQLHVDSSEKSRDAYLQQFSLGQRTLLDLLDSENEVFVARQALANARYDHLFASYRVLNSMGSLLHSLQVALPETASAEQ